MTTMYHMHAWWYIATEGQQILAIVLLHAALEYQYKCKSYMI